MDSEFIKYSLKEYFKRKDKDLNKLMKYAKELGVLNKINDLVELFYE